MQYFPNLFVLGLLFSPVGHVLYRTGVTTLAGVAHFVGEPAHELKDHGFYSRSGHMPSSGPWPVTVHT